MGKLSFTAKDGTRYAFANSTQFLEFLNAEVMAWQWLQNFAGHPYAVPFYDGIFGQLNATIRAASATPVDETALLESFSAYLDFIPQVHAKTSFRTWFDPLTRSNPRQAVYLLGQRAVTAGRIGAFDAHHGGASDMAAGVAKAVAFDEPPPLSIKISAYEKSAEESARNAAAALAAAVEHQSTIETLEATLSETETVRTETRRVNDEATAQAVETLVSELSTKVQDAQDTLKKQLDEYRTEVNSQLTLRAPSIYWHKKHAAHSKWVWGLSLAALLAGLVGAYVLNNIAYAVFGQLKFNQVPTWFQGISFSLGALVYVLVLRSLLRLMMSHVHLALDASERQTMIVSYLAMQRKSALPQESLDKILATIFRPTGDGIVKDEGVPLSLMAEFFKK